MQAVRQKGNAPLGEVVLIFTRDGDTSLERLIVVCREKIKLDSWIRAQWRFPRMLMKKLERNVWKPNAVSVAPGMTSRMVRA